MLKPKPDPLKDLLAIQEQINKLFEDRLQHGEGFGLPAPSDRAGARSGAWVPPVDAWETEAAFVLRIELPGLSASDVTIGVHDRTLEIRGERKKPADSGVRSYHRVEREYGTFLRAFTLPNGVASFDVESTWEDGVLQVMVSKSEPEASESTGSPTGGDTPTRDASKRAAKPPSKKRK